MPIAIDGTVGSMANGNSNVTVAAGSNITFSVTSTANVLTITTAALIPTGNGTVALGATGSRFSNLWGLSSSAQYADLAEMYRSDKEYDPGTVLVFGGEHEVTQSTITHDPKIAGVVSTKPAFLMNDDHSRAGIWLPVALQGRVPCRVKGPIEKGQQVVSSNIPGTAEAFDESKHNNGCVIGKALVDYPMTDEAVIEVVVGRI